MLTKARRFTVSRTSRNVGMRSPRAGVELADLSKGLARQRATTIGRPFEALIVKDDKFAIDELHVDLDARRAEFERPADGAQRILRLVTRGAAVANGDEIRGGSVGHRVNQGAAAAGNVIALDAVAPSGTHKPVSRLPSAPATSGVDPAIERRIVPRLSSAPGSGGVEELQGAAVVGRGESDFPKHKERRVVSGLDRIERCELSGCRPVSRCEDAVLVVFLATNRPTRCDPRRSPSQLRQCPRSSYSRIG
jgi:hypothetical protein